MLSRTLENHHKLRASSCYVVGFLTPKNELFSGHVNMWHGDTDVTWMKTVY